MVATMVVFLSWGEKDRLFWRALIHQHPFSSAIPVIREEGADDDQRNGWDQTAH